MEIRYITPSDDTLAISKVYEESWKYAYKGIIPQDYLNSIPEGLWVSSLDNPDRNTLICIENGKIIGTSSFGKSRFSQFENYGEIISIYFLPEYMGKGYGRALMNAAVAELKKLGYDKVFLWVLEENTAARHFYEKFGFLSSGIFSDYTIAGRKIKEVGYIYNN